MQPARPTVPGSPDLTYEVRQSHGERFLAVYGPGGYHMYALHGEHPMLVDDSGVYALTMAQARAAYLWAQRLGQQEAA